MIAGVVLRERSVITRRAITATDRWPPGIAGRSLKELRRETALTQAMLARAIAR